jgi:hypothetical protein
VFPPVDPSAHSITGAPGCGPHSAGSQSPTGVTPPPPHADAPHAPRSASSTRLARARVPPPTIIALTSSGPACREPSGHRLPPSTVRASTSRPPPSAAFRRLAAPGGRGGGKRGQGPRPELRAGFCAPQRRPSPSFRAPGATRYDETRRPGRRNTGTPSVPCTPGRSSRSAPSTRTEPWCTPSVLAGRAAARPVPLLWLRDAPRPQLRARGEDASATAARPAPTAAPTRWAFGLRLGAGLLALALATDLARPRPRPLRERGRSRKDRRTLRRSDAGFAESRS